jgi:hypothetical protein
VSAKKRKKAAAKAKRRGRGATGRMSTPQSTSAQIPRPRVTEYNQITVVPVFPGGEAGPPSGFRGSYDVVFVLGVPGVSGVATHLDFDGMRAGGDSLLLGSGLQLDIQPPDGGPPYAARIIPNSRGRLAQVRLTVSAEDFSVAEQKAFDIVMPVLSRIAFEADTPVEVTGVLLTERATQTRRLGATLAGAIQAAPELAWDMTPEIRPFLAAYREGLNANSPLYQALSFYKVIEGVPKFHKKRVRAAARSGTMVPPDPMAKQVPSDRRDLADMTDWARENFAPYLGKSFVEIRDAVEHTIRDAIAHITPGLDLRIADDAADIRACREIVPVLRYMARELIRDEITGLSSSGSSAGRPAA